MPETTDESPETTEAPAVPEGFQGILDKDYDAVTAATAPEADEKSDLAVDPTPSPTDYSSPWDSPEALTFNRRAQALQQAVDLEKSTLAIGSDVDADGVVANAEKFYAFCTQES